MNVQPMLGQVVGVELKKPHDTQLEGAYMFPQRAGSVTVNLPPEHLPMLLDVRARRTLNALKRQEGKSAMFIGRTTSGGYMEVGTIDHVSVEGNAIQITVGAQERIDTVSIPSEVVEAVWLDGQVCKLRLAGYFDHMMWNDHAHERLKQEKLIFLEVQPPTKSSGDRRVRITELPRTASDRLAESVERALFRVTRILRGRGRA